MYNFELLSAFLFFLVIGAIFSPFLSGCVVLLFILFMFGAIVVFFSLNFIWFVIAGSILYLISFISKYRRWHKLPIFAQYVSLHPNCEVGDSVCCYNCGSSNTQHHGLFSKKGRLRYYVCSACGTNLFRFKVL